MISKKCLKHKWVYRGGECKCSVCKKFLQPNGNVTSTANGRTIKKAKGTKSR